MPLLSMFGDSILFSLDPMEGQAVVRRAWRAMSRQRRVLGIAVRQALSRLHESLEQLVEPAAPMFEALRLRLGQAFGGLAVPGRCADSVAEVLELRQLLSATFYVSTTGSDTNSGTAAAPFRTIQHAATIAGPGDTVDIFGGTYDETVTPAQSGTAGAPITYQAVAGQKVIIDGAETISGWTQYSGSIYVANDPYNLGFGNNQVFNNGQAMIFAQWPNTSLDLSHPTVAYAQSGSGGTLVDSALSSSGVNWTGATIHIESGESWVAQTATVTSDSGDKLTFSLANTGDPDGGVQPGNAFYLTGSFQALNAPDEWYVSGGKLYFWAPDGGVPQNVQVKARTYGFDLSGKSYININNINLFACSVIANGSNHITLSSITDQYVSQFLTLADGWNAPVNTGVVLNGSGNTIQDSNIAYSAGDGILLLGSGNVASNNVVTGCDYNGNDNAGIRAVGNGDTISGNVVSDCGRDGIKFSGATNIQITNNTVHDVMLQTTDGGGIYTYGTDGAGSLIANNRVYNVYSGGWGAAGLYLDNGSYDYTVRDNTVYDANIGIKMNPPSYDNTIEDNTLLGNMQSVASYGDEDMSGSKFIDNVFDNTLMIKGSVTLTDNETVSGSYKPALSSVIIPPVPGLPLVTGNSTPSSAPTPAPTPTPTPSPSPTPAPTPTPAGAVDLSFAELVSLSRDESASNRTRISSSALPSAVAKTFAMETVGVKSAVAYYEFTLDDQVFYSAHYSVGGGKRDDTRVYETGRLLSKLVLSGSAATADQAEAAAGN